MYKLEDLETQFDKIDLDAILSVDEHNMAESMLTLAQDYWRLQSLCAKINSILDVSTEKLKYSTAVRSEEIRASHMPAKLSAQRLEYLIDSDKELLKQRLYITSVKTLRNLVYGALRSLDNQKDMLKSAGFYKSKEPNFEPY